jgi:hypothetical protein
MNTDMAAENISVCPECGAIWRQNDTCQDRFYQMLYWESKNPDDGAQVHHLMVLCYHLQHPGMYSPEGLSEGLRLLDAFLRQGADPAKVRRQSQASVDSSSRTWKIGATSTSHGSYDPPIKWGMTTVDVIGRGRERYRDSIQAWAQSICAVLEASGLLPSD